MLRKIVIYVSMAACAALLCLYFTAASSLAGKNRDETVCTSVNVKILDSNENRFVSAREAMDIIEAAGLNPIGLPLAQIDIGAIERALDHGSAIRKSDVSLRGDGRMEITVTQRKPVLRIEGEDGGFYVDGSCYIFPLSASFTSYVPVISGDIPLEIPGNFRGRISEDKDAGWLESAVRLGMYIESHPFWKAQVQQIDIGKNREATIYMRVGDQKIKFGTFDGIEGKFAKLKAFYRKIVPAYGWEEYSVIDLRFSDQIICKKRQ